MNFRQLGILTVAAIGTAGCAASADPGHASVEGATAALTTQECADQRDSCLRTNPLFGLITCPAQYDQCLVTASNGIPAEVAAAVSDTATCARTADRCRAGAETPGDALKCAQDEAKCVSDVIGANLPEVVTGTAACVDDTVSCVNDSRSVDDLANCARTLERCTRDQVVSTLPPEVGNVVKDVNDCVSALNACTGDASSPGDLTACAQTEAHCVATSLGVTPPPPVAAAVSCVETAVNCTLDATTADKLRGCAADLVSCDARIANPEATLTCEQKWTQCLVREPFNFPKCGGQLAACRSGD
jgi:hypothetical protein